jgi:hypothetical protein
MGKTAEPYLSEARMSTENGRPTKARVWSARIQAWAVSWRKWFKKIPIIQILILVLSLAAIILSILGMNANARIARSQEAFEATQSAAQQEIHDAQQALASQDAWIKATQRVAQTNQQKTQVAFEGQVGATEAALMITLEHQFDQQAHLQETQAAFEVLQADAVATQTYQDALVAELYRMLAYPYVRFVAPVPSFNMRGVQLRTSETGETFLEGYGILDVTLTNEGGGSAELTEITRLSTVADTLIQLSQTTSFRQREGEVVFPVTIDAGSTISFSIQISGSIFIPEPPAVEPSESELALQWETLLRAEDTGLAFYFSNFRPMLVAIPPLESPTDTAAITLDETLTPEEEPFALTPTKTAMPAATPTATSKVPRPTAETDRPEDKEKPGKFPVIPVVGLVVVLILIGIGALFLFGTSYMVVEVRSYETDLWLNTYRMRFSIGIKTRSFSDEYIGKVKVKRASRDETMFYRINFLDDNEILDFYPQGGPDSVPRRTFVVVFQDERYPETGETPGKNIENNGQHEGA